MSEQGPPFLSSEPIAGNLPATPRFRTWLRNLLTRVDLSSLATLVPPQTTKSASIATTDMSGGNLSAGLYSISWYLPIVTAEPASTVQVAIGWVDQAGSKSYTAPVVDGSVTTTPQVNQRVTIYSQGASPITYTVTYVGATMQYSFYPTLQSMGSAA